MLLRNSTASANTESPLVRVRFTLIELLVVIGIIAVLASLVLAAGMLALMGGRPAGGAVATPGRSGLGLHQAEGALLDSNSRRNGASTRLVADLSPSGLQRR